MLRINTSSIKTIKNIREILDSIHYNTTVLFDLDNMIMKALTEVGSDQWFEKLLKHACSINTNTQQACKEVIDIYTAVQHHINTVLVEEETALIINALQDIGLRVIGITARDHSLSDSTHRQLLKNKIDFGKKDKSKITVKLNIKDKDSQENKVITILYDRGIIFCSGQNKGFCFEHYKNASGKEFDNIVMGDDKQKHLENVQVVAAKLGIPFTGFRYAFLDEEIERISMEAAHIQLLHLKERLSNEVQSFIDKLNIRPNDFELNHSHYSQFFAHPNEIKSRRQSPIPEREIEIKTAKDPLQKPTEIDLLQKPTLKRAASEVCLFSSKRQKNEGINVAEDLSCRQAFS